MPLKTKIDNSFFIILLFFISSFFILNAVGSDSVPKDMSSEEKQEVFDKFRLQQKNNTSLCASINQEKQLSVLNKKVFIEGRVIMAKPNMLRWDVFSPEKSITVLDGREMTVYYPDKNEARVTNLSSSMVMRKTMEFFSSMMWGSLDKLEKKFKLNMFRKNNSIFFNLKPLSRMAAKYIESIVIVYDEKTGMPKSFQTTTAKGDNVTTILSDVQVNPEIKPDTFTINIPPNAVITNATKDNQN